MSSGSGRSQRRFTFYFDMKDRREAALYESFSRLKRAKKKALVDFLLSDYFGLPKDPLFGLSVDKSFGKDIENSGFEKLKMQPKKKGSLSSSSKKSLENNVSNNLSELDSDESGKESKLKKVLLKNEYLSTSVHGDKKSTNEGESIFDSTLEESSDLAFLKGAF